jgi:hypothetical protein
VLHDAPATTLPPRDQVIAATSDTRAAGRGVVLKSTALILGCAAVLSFLGWGFRWWVSGFGLDNEHVRYLLMGALQPLPIAITVVLAGRSRLRWPLALLPAAALGAVLGWGHDQIEFNPEMSIALWADWALLGASVAIASLAASLSPRLVLRGVVFGVLAAVGYHQILRAVWIEELYHVWVDSELLTIVVRAALPGALIGTSIAIATGSAPRVTTGAT